MLYCSTKNKHLEKKIIKNGISCIFLIFGSCFSRIYCIASSFLLAKQSINKQRY